jgi:hypothetical protein
LERTENKFYLFIDESGDHGLTTLNPSFPVFVLGGVLMSKSNYTLIRDEFNDIKKEFWQDKKVIFHSRDIRKCEKEFQILFNMDLKSIFYEKLNSCLTNNDYTVIAAAINKDKYIKKYGKISNDVYEIALSFLIERAVFYLDDLNITNKSLEIIIEKRGKKEDQKLKEHFQKLKSRGTGFVQPHRLQEINLKIYFEHKNRNINGLQLADLIAYPTARYVIDKERANPAFDIIESKIYSKNGRRYGLKVFP